MAALRLRARLARVLTVATVTALIASVALASTAVAEQPGRSKLSKQDRERLAAAAANGSSTVTMLFATVEASTGSVANALEWAHTPLARSAVTSAVPTSSRAPTTRTGAVHRLAGTLASGRGTVLIDRRQPGGLLPPAAVHRDVQ